jgi:hypothetical protein
MRSALLVDVFFFRMVELVTTTLDNLDKEISNFKESISVVCVPPIMMKFTTPKHLRWLFQRLGPRVFSNPNLILDSHEEIELFEKRMPRDKEAPLSRADQLTFLCPRCRKQLALKEKWGR